jgi:predicted SAM-dependent methyltransferase
MKVSISHDSKFRRIYENANRLLCRLLFYPYVLRYYFSPLKKHRKLHVGCGNNFFPNWVNSDIHPKSDLIIFLQKRLPLKNSCIDRIYSEHVLEHVTYKVAVFFLKEAHRTLKPNGVIRIAMPDLDDLVDGYLNDWRRLDWVNWPEFAFIRTKAEMINMAFRWWGHKHLYNQEELVRAFREAGFSNIVFEQSGRSRYPDLRGLETRLDSKLIAEAVKDRS